MQACVRRWLARTQYRKNQSRAASSAVTLQKHVRGWLTRRRIFIIKEREREARESLAQELKRREDFEQKRREEESRAKIAAAKAKILRKINAPEISPFESKSELRRVKDAASAEKAAALIQSRKKLHICNIQYI